MSIKTTKPNTAIKKVGESQDRTKRLQLIKEAAERHRTKALWRNQ